MRTSHCSVLRRSRPGLLILLAVPCLFVACSKSLPPPSEIDQGMTLLNQVLDTWKQGDSPDALASGKPSVRVIDRDWTQGFRLIDYQLVGEPNHYGLEVIQAVTLELEDENGRPLRKEVNYLITTGANPLVAREDMDE